MNSEKNAWLWGLLEFYMFKVTNVNWGVVQKEEGMMR